MHQTSSMPFWPSKYYESGGLKPSREYHVEPISDGHIYVSARSKHLKFRSGRSKLILLELYSWLSSLSGKNKTKKAWNCYKTLKYRVFRRGVSASKLPKKFVGPLSSTYNCYLFGLRVGEVNSWILTWRKDLIAGFSTDVQLVHSCPKSSKSFFLGILICPV